jgi:hypothetical protein
LHDLKIEPGLLNVSAHGRLANRLNSRDRRISDTIDRGDARSDGISVHVNGASAAQSLAAAEFRACHSQHVADNPQQWRVAIDIDDVIDPINLGRECHRDPLTPTGLSLSNRQQPEPTLQT